MLPAFYSSFILTIEHTKKTRLSKETTSLLLLLPDSTPVSKADAVAIVSSVKGASLVTTVDFVLDSAASGSSDTIVVVELAGSESDSVSLPFTLFACWVLVGTAVVVMLFSV